MNKIMKQGEQIRFICIRCGKCCSSGPNVALSAFDVCRIASYMHTSWRELAGRYFYVIIADQIPVLVLRGVNDRCIFMYREGELASCKIYPSRPARCRLYPFIPVAPGTNNELEVSLNCPGIGSGDLIDPPWNDLSQYTGEIRQHYRKLYNYIFEENMKPLQALERLLDTICGSSSH
ncbi:MAG: YkgJ family cysteine cluster protein [Desulfurococcaceae archaeon]